MRKKSFSLQKAVAITVRQHLTRGRIWEQAFLNTYTRMMEVMHQRIQERLQSGRLQPTAKVLQKSDVYDTLDTDYWEEFIATETRRILGDIVSDGGQQGLDLAGMGGWSFNIFDERARDFLNEYPYVFAREINDTTMDMLQETLAEGFAEGENMRDLSERVTEAFEGAVDQTGYRATRTARTEVNRAQNFGLNEGYEQAGVEKKMWLIADVDARHPPDSEFDHLGANGEIVGIDEPFTRTGEDLMYPGDPDGSPGNTINCRCISSPVID